MRVILLAVLIGIASCLLGLASVWFVLEREPVFNRVTSGQWASWPTLGEPGTDPYSEAFLARRGSTWMSTTEGISLFANTDTDNIGLTAECRYLVHGFIPRGRIWTLSAQPLSATEAIPTTAENTTVLTSSSAIWNEDNSIAISVAQTVQSGNWLPVAAADTFALILRIYDTPLTTTILQSPIDVPAIERVSCQ